MMWAGRLVSGAVQGGPGHWKAERSSTGREDRMSVGYVREAVVCLEALTISLTHMRPYDLR